MFKTTEIFVMANVFHFWIIVSYTCATISRMKYFPMNTRNKLLLFTGLFVNFLYGVVSIMVTYLKVIRSLDYCAICYFLTSLTKLGIEFIYLFSILNLYLKHKRQQNLRSNKKSGFSGKIILFFSSAWKTIFLISIFFIVLMIYPFIRMLLYSKADSVVNLCDAAPFYQLSVTILIFVFDFVMCLKLRKCKDNYGLRLEIYACCSILAVCTVPYLIMKKSHFKAYSGVVVLGFLQCHLIISYMRPFILTFRKEKLVKEQLDETFQKVLGDKKLLDKFWGHLEKEFACENLVVYQKINSFKKIFDQDFGKSVIEAEQIYSNFIASGAEWQINLSSFQLKSVDEMMAEGKYYRSMFDKVQKEVYELMRNDSFRRFLLSHEID